MAHTVAELADGMKDAGAGDETNQALTRNDPSSDSDSDAGFDCKVCQKSFPGYNSLAQHTRSAKHLKALMRKGRGKRAKSMEDKLFELSSEDDTETLEQVEFAADYDVDLRCVECQKTFVGVDSYHQHLNSKAHSKVLRQKKLMQTILGQDKAASEDLAQAVPPDDHEDNLHCSECRKSFTGVVSYYQHINSKLHSRVIKQKKLLRKIMGEGSAQPADRSKSSTTIVSDTDVGDIDMTADVLACRLCKMSFTGPESAFSHIRGKGHAKKLENLKWKKSRSAAPDQNTGESSKEHAGSSPKSVTFADHGHQENTESESIESENEEVHGTASPKDVRNETSV